MKIGDVITTKNMKHQGFGPRSSSFTFKAAPDALMVYMYMGNITLDSAPHFNANGVLAALGFGPILATVTQRRLIDALKSARQFADSLEDFGDEELAKIDAALAAAGNFETITEAVDPILKDAAMFRALLAKLGDAPLVADTLWDLLGRPNYGADTTQPGGRLRAIIEAAIAK